MNIRSVTSNYGSTRLSHFCFHFSKSFSDKIPENLLNIIIIYDFGGLCQVRSLEQMNRDNSLRPDGPLTTLKKTVVFILHLYFIQRITQIPEKFRKFIISENLVDTLH